MHQLITFQMNWVNYLLFIYQNIILFIYFKKIPCLFLSDPSLHEYIYDCKIPPSTSPILPIPHQYYTNPALYVTYYMTSTLILPKPCLPDYKTPHIRCYLLSTVHIIHITTIKLNHLTPIIHNILSINLHTSTHHPIKTHHNSQHS